MSEVIEDAITPEENTMRRSPSVIFSVTFIRHGETEANRERKIQGHLDIPLSSLGKVQASQAGESLCKTAFTRAYTSDLCRAYSTCEHILKENSCILPSIKVDERLRERNFGSVEGMNIDEVKAKAASEGLMWTEYNPPGAESLGDLQARMVAFFKELSQSVYDKNRQKISSGVENGCEDKEDTEITDNIQLLEEGVPVEKILVVGHGAALKQLYIHFHKTLGCNTPGDFDEINKISPNTGISEYIIRFSPKKYNLQCVRLHDGGHLQDP
ncbi:fructose-2,6-bisphosphatase TIGAR isoform X2 [Procambarus clarkii]|nr:fructose-2,6-bisphosphatase TIGAR-like isoform X1 [Procambarus clarkii]XP_045603938.1 fructose-2,6-bisphosphatase TIGAR-like isoform X1 [Procambarus clarkii]XP_045603939.1 fructose-2,6-bisphosphatase TIGAR-like isoform X1 [Procambarus clarkii]XP_045603940.1 fructose-2,6-bisphosphatase TIGAR-like isoform X1 [Procambarus clarkii]